MSNVTMLLGAAAGGDRSAASELLPLVYEELRRLASQRLAHERPGQTLQPTALVHEAYMRLVNGPDASEPKWEGRRHFFGAAAEAMRRILIEAARRKGRVKHGGEQRRVELGEHDVPVEAPPDDLLALDEALTKLAVEDAASAKIVELHFFAGLSMDEIAELLGVSRATAYRQWSYARAWLRCEMGGEGDLPEL